MQCTEGGLPVRPHNVKEVQHYWPTHYWPEPLGTTRRAAMAVQ